jgi:hypothetical protein
MSKIANFGQKTQGYLGVKDGENCFFSKMSSITNGIVRKLTSI